MLELYICYFHSFRNTVRQDSAWIFCSVLPLTHLCFVNPLQFPLSVSGDLLQTQAVEVRQKHATMTLTISIK